MRKLRRPSISVIIFILLLGSIVYFVRKSNIQNEQTITQGKELKRLAGKAAIQADEARRLTRVVVAQQNALTTLAREAEANAARVKDCSTPEGECFKAQKARDEAVAKQVVQGVSSANRRLITREVKQVETTTQVQGEATRVTVEEKTEQVKKVVVDKPASQAPMCLLPIGGLGLICQTEPQP